MLPPKPIRVLVADSHEMVRLGLALFVDVYDGLELVGIAEDGSEALNLCATHQPDVVLLSLHLPPVDGLDTTRLIRQAYPQIHVVVMSHTNRPEEVEAAIHAGASGYMIKALSLDEIAKTIRAAMP